MTTSYLAAWNQARYGSATIDWTDASGSHSVTISTGKFNHIAPTIYARDVNGVAQTIALGVDSTFAAALQTAMDAATAQTVTVAWAVATGYTLTCTGGTFTITFSGDAGTRMRRILGFTGNRSGSTSYVSQARERFRINALIDARTNYAQPAATDGQVSTARIASGLRYHIGPTVFAKEGSWEHHFEPKRKLFRAFADADTVSAGENWTWEDLFEHAVQGLPVLYSAPDVSNGYVAIQLTPGFMRESFRRVRNDMDTHQIVRVNASIIGQDT